VIEPKGAFMNALIIILGFIILVAGNQLPWIFVAAVGFIGGIYLGEHAFLALSGIKLVLFSMGIALICGLLVIYFKRVMVVLAGFLCGVYVCYYLPESLGWSTSWISLPVLILVGAIFAVLILVWFSLPLILVSSLTGATLVIQYIQFQRINEFFLFIIMFLFGITAQWVLLQYSRPENE
jgi:hypothetical protein